MKELCNKIRYNPAKNHIYYRVTKQITDTIGWENICRHSDHVRRHLSVLFPFDLTGRIVCEKIRR